MTYIAHYKSIQSFAEFKRQHLSKIYTYEDEQGDLTYFFFYKKQKSKYYINDLKNASCDHDEKIKELKNEFKQLQLK